jgi:two-component system, LuxR family, response regulator FixJ
MNVDPTVFVLGDGSTDLAGLCELVESANLRVETFHSTSAFLDQYDPTRPGCVVLLVPRLAQEGVELQHRLNELGYSVPVIIISARSDMALAVRAMKAGALSVLQSPVESQVMLDTIREAIAKDTSTRQANARAIELRKRLALLTPREREVMELLMNGKANKEVAARLELSEKTIEIHRAHVLKKLQAPNLAALVRLVVLADPALIQCE